MIDQIDLDNLKQELLGYYEGETMPVDVNLIADLINEVEKIRMYEWVHQQAEDQLRKLYESKQQRMVEGF